MAKPTSNPKLKLLGFNNLTKSLSFNIYDICYARTAQHQQEYVEYIDEAYNAERLTDILTEVADIIGANILNVARQDYDPQGASVTMLISEGHQVPQQPTVVNKDSVVAHLDKSHITVHTYPESHPDQGISTFRADVDVSTCGQISPLKVLNFLINSFESDIVIADYTMPGFSGTRALAIVRAEHPDLPFIFVSGTIGEDTAVEAMKTGAHDYIMKANLTRLAPAVARELRERGFTKIVSLAPEVI